MDELIMTALFLAFAALIAAIVRMYDTPVDKAAIVPFLKTYASSLIAAVLVGWMLESTGELKLEFVPFAIVAGTSVGGLAFVRGLMEQYSKFTAKE